MALFPNGLGCLLPVPDGDCLKLLGKNWQTLIQHAQINVPSNGTLADKIDITMYLLY